jgi:hypothetical protein
LGLPAANRQGDVGDEQTDPDEGGGDGGSFHGRERVGQQPDVEHRHEPEEAKRHGRQAREHS